MKRKRIVIAVTNDLVTDQRVHKVATTLQRCIGEVTLVGRQRKSNIPLKRHYATKRMKLLFNHSAFFYLEYNVRLFFLLLFQKSDIIVANDLDTLLACFLVAKIKNSKLVYDSHEYFTQVPELITRPRVQKVWLALEKCILPKLKYSYTVCQSIAEVYARKYGIAMRVVRNVPLRQEEREGSPKKSPFVIVYQGAINVGRGIEEAILAMKYVQDAELWIFGSGDIEEAINSLIAKENLGDRVMMKGRVPFEQLHKETLKASLGLCIEKGKEMGESYHYALPNKLFDYIQAGVPVLINDLPEKRRILDDYNVGFVLEDETPKAIARQITTIINSDLASLQPSLKKAAKELCWEREERQLLAVYQALD